MPTYTIQAVAPQTRPYESKFGNMISYKVKFTTEADAVEISQKESTPAPQAGDVLTGDIIEGQYGKKFKKEYSAGGFSGSGSTTGSVFNGAPATKPAFTPRDDSHIKAQWAIGQAMTFQTAINTDGEIKLSDVEELAKELFAMVDHVKGGSESESPKASGVATQEASTTTGSGERSASQTDGDSSVLDDLFPDVQPVDQGELPWNPGS